MNIYTIANVNYLGFLKDFLSSPGFENFSGTIIIISPDIKLSHLESINKWSLDVELRLPVVNGYAHGRFPGFLFSRFAELLSDESDAMYIDSDTVVNTSLESILSDFKSDGLYAVEERFQKYPLYFKLRHLKLRYYNAGVIFKKGPAIYTKNECIQHVNEFTIKSRYPDQDFFNIIYYHLIQSMDEKFNYINYSGRSIVNGTVIYHYAHKKFINNSVNKS